MKKMLFLSTAAVLFIILAVYLNQEKGAVTKLRLGDNSYMDDIRIIQKKDGVIKWILGAKRAVFVANNEVELVDLKITFPEKELILISNEGMYDMESRNLKIEGNIKASIKDYDIVTTTLFWDSTKNEILSDEKVYIVGKRFFVEGDSLTATIDKARLDKNVKVIFYE